MYVCIILKLKLASIEVAKWMLAKFCAYVLNNKKEVNKNKNAKIYENPINIGCHERVVLE